MLSHSTALTLIASGVGFAAALFFCVGNISNSPARIVDQAAMRWDFSEPVARALASQRAQYIAGALLLVLSFALQVAAPLVSGQTPSPLPAWLQDWRSLVLATFIPSLAVGALIALAVYLHTMRRVLRTAPPQPPAEPPHA